MINDTAVLDKVQGGRSRNRAIMVLTVGGESVRVFGVKQIQAGTAV